MTPEPRPMTTDLAALAERLWKLTGPGREIDADILWLTDRSRAERYYWNAATGTPRPLPHKRPTKGLGATAIVNGAPHYTSDYNAAISLIPSGCVWAAGTTDEDDYPWATVTTPDDHKDHCGEGATVIIAICIASMLARDHQAKVTP